MANTTPEDRELLIEIYKEKAENFRFYLNHMIKLLIMYLTVVGAILKFSLEQKASNEMFYILMSFGCLFCVFAEYGRIIHLNAIFRLKEALSAIAQKMMVINHIEDCDNFANFVKALRYFNAVLGLSFIAFIVLKYKGIIA